MIEEYDLYDPGFYTPEEKAQLIEELVKEGQDIFIREGSRLSLYAAARLNEISSALCKLGYSTRRKRGK